ncbi:glycerophosphodiester phosphodiesterase [soil metagenome]
MTVVAPLVIAPLVIAPLVIAHRGACGYRPEHTRAAYDLAIDQGADLIEPDLVMTRDGHLVVRHENEIGGTTDVCDHGAFAERHTTRAIDGATVQGWFTEDFTLAELGTLRARERLRDLRPANTAYDGREPILTFQQVIDIARAGSLRTGRTIGVCPELKHPSHFAALGLAMLEPFLAVLEDNALTGADAAVLIQCFEVQTLRTLRARIDAPLLQLIAAGSGPVDRPDLTPARMISPAGLAEIATYATAIGIETTLIQPRAEDGSALPLTTLTSDAHAVGLQVVAWTFRAENVFLPLDHRRGIDPAAHGDLTNYLHTLQSAGLDAVFSDFPDIAVAARR